MIADKPHSKCTFVVGATPVDIEDVEKQLHVELPESLRTLLQESNGVSWHLTIGDCEQYILSLIWSTAEIIEENLYFRSTNPDASSKTFLFFGSEGNGNQFGFRVTDGKVTSEDIFDWSHDDGNYEKSSCSLREHLRVLERL